MTRLRVCVAGGGAWGTALGAHLASVGHDVRLWMRDPASRARDQRVDRRNERYLPGLALPDGLLASADLAASADGAATAFVAVPSEFARPVYRELAPPAAAAAARSSRPPRASSSTRSCA